MSANIKVKFELPRMPNFIILDLGRVSGEPRAKIHVGDLDQDQVEGIAEAWCIEFEEHCRQFRNAKPDSETPDE